MTVARDSNSGNGRAERLLGSLAGVVSAHVVTDAAGKIVEIHILSTPDLHPKQVVRNVESALSAGLGIAIDRRIVSVAQVRTTTPGDANGNGDPRPAGALADLAAIGDPEDPDDAPPVNALASRLEYVSFQSRRDAERCVCEVALRDGAKEVVGTGTGTDTAGGRAEAAARAVLQAIERARPELRLELDGAVISASRGRSFVIIAAHALLQRTTVPLAGAATLARSPEEAAILATLQATNRWSA